MPTIDVDRVFAEARRADGCRHLQKAIEAVRAAAGCLGVISETQVQRAVTVLEMVLRLESRQRSAELFEYAKKGEVGPRPDIFSTAERMNGG